MQKSQSGIIQLPLLIAIIGVIAFLTLVSIAPLKNSLLSSIFPKKYSQAATGPFNDTWVFYGDSITAVTMNPGANDFAHRVHNQLPNAAITQFNEGYGGNNMSSSTIGDINGLIAKYPNAKYITVNLGTNNSNGSDNSRCYTDPDVFYNDFVSVVTAINNASKIPVVPTVPWRNDPNIIQCTVNINNQIKKLYTNKSFVVPGPDLFTIFNNRPDLMPFHPTSTGTEVYLQSWADWAVTNIYNGTPLPSVSPIASASVQPPATASPSPVPSTTPLPSTITVDFNTYSGPDSPLSGQYPANIIDWGTGNWVTSGAWKKLTTRSISLPTSSATTGTFLVLPQKVLTGLDAYNGGTAPSTITLKCSGNPDKVVTLAADQLLAVSTGWTDSCAAVSVSSSNGWNTNYDNLVLSSPVIPSPSIAPSPTPSQSPAKPGDIDGNNKVDIFDYNILLTNFGKTGSGLLGDFDNNAKVDIFDFNVLLTNFGK